MCLSFFHIEIIDIKHRQDSKYYTMLPHKLKQFTEHTSTVLSLLTKALVCNVIKDRLWTRDVIESILLIVKEDSAIIGDKYLSDVLYKAVMTCRVNSTEFADIRSKGVGTASWYHVLSDNTLAYKGDTLNTLQRLLSESNNEPTKWGGGVRSSYFEIASMYIHSQYHRTTPGMLEYITRVLNTYSDIKDISTDYKETTVAVLRMQIDKEHAMRKHEFTSEIEMEYRIRMSIFNANEHVSDDQSKIFEIELEDELENRREAFQKQLSREKDSRLSMLETHIDNIGADNRRLLRALKNMTSIVLERLNSSSA